MRKLRFKNRNGILYYGLGNKFRSSRLKFTNINKNIIIGKFKQGLLDDDLNIVNVKDSVDVVSLVNRVIEDKQSTIKQNSINTYSNLFNTHIVPYFKDEMVSSVKPIHIKKFQDALVEKGYSKSTINHLRGLLSDAFEYAILSEFIAVNPVKMVSAPKIKRQKKKHKAFTLDEIDLILSNSGGEIRNFLGISFFTGIRSGELLALQWSDVDFEDDTITINKTLSAGAIGTAKTFASERDIEMLPKAKEFLRSQQLLTGLKNSYVFLNTKNTHYINNEHFSYSFKKLLKRLNIEKRSLHNTRHTFASIMLNNGIDALWVSNTLGHENLKITLDTYTHYLPKKEKMSIGFLEKRYKNGTDIR